MWSLSNSIRYFVYEQIRAKLMIQSNWKIRITRLGKQYTTINFCEAPYFTKSNVTQSVSKLTGNILLAVKVEYSSIEYLVLDCMQEEKLIWPIAGKCFRYSKMVRPLEIRQECLYLCIWTILSKRLSFSRKN